MLTNRPLKELGKWITAAAILSTLSVAGWGVYLYVNLRSNAEPQAQPSPVASPTQVAVTALGRIEPKDGITKVAAPSGESQRVSQLLVREGDRVQAGQVIAEMDNRVQLEAAVQQAAAEVEEAEQRLAQVRAGAKPADVEAERANVARLEVELDQAQRDYDRYERLYQEGAISEADLDNRQLRVDTVARQLEEARQQLNSVRDVRSVDVELAASQVEVAMSRLKRAQADLETALVRAPISGQVIKIHADSGEQVGEDGIVELGSTNAMYVIAEVYETDIGKVRVGQPATIASSTFPDKSITGIVEYVGLAVNRNDVLSSDPAADMDTRVVEVKIRLNDSQTVAGLTNLQVNVAIEMQE